MKLLTYQTDKGPRCGVLQNDEIVDVSGLLGATSHTIHDVKQLLERGDSPLDRIREELARNAPSLEIPSCLSFESVW